jgi:hypothetical protein
MFGAGVNNIPLPVGTAWTGSYWHVPAHLRRTVIDVPCGELTADDNPCGKASSISSIAISAWLNEVYAQSRRQLASPADLYDNYFRACRLLLKSLDDSELKRVFDEQIAPKL